MATFKTKPIAVPENWQALEAHPLASIVPFGVDIDMRGMVTRMKANGYDEDEAIILIMVGTVLMILNGRHRHHAAKLAGVTPTFRLYAGDNPEQFVLKKADQQHLSTQHRAILGARLLALAKETASLKSDDNPNVLGGIRLESDTSAAATAKKVGVSDQSIIRAAKVEASKNNDLKNLLEDGHIGLAEAAEIAELSVDEQDQRLSRFFCDRCHTTGARIPCHRCKDLREQNRRGKKSKPSEPAPAPTRPMPTRGPKKPKVETNGKHEPKNGTPLFDMRTLTSHLGKALAEINMLARQYGFVNKSGAIKDPPELAAIRAKITSVGPDVVAWRKELEKSKTNV